MPDFLQNNRFGFISAGDKEFISRLRRRDEQARIRFWRQDWQRLLLGKIHDDLYKNGGKSKQVYARIYIRDDGIALRLFLNDIDKHRGYIEKSQHISKRFCRQPWRLPALSK